MIARTTSVNLKELSLLTGFSVSTISKALNNKLDISNETKELIACVAEKHNYVPNGFAVGLRNKESKAIAIILPQINIDRYSTMLYNFQKNADRYGYRIVIFQSFKKHSRETKYLHSLCDGSIDGAIVITSLKNNFYSEKYALPVTTSLVSEVKKIENLETYCTSIFKKLFKEIR